jgi:predicted nucleotidyltransferase component of viral defense system
MQQFYRTATSDEIRFYENRLYPLQDRVFEITSVYEDQLYLIGGTALARFHFNHRFSEDLDFFTDTDDLKRIATESRKRFQLRGYLNLRMSKESRSLINSF